MTKDIEKFCRGLLKKYSEAYTYKLKGLYSEAYKSNSEPFLFSDISSIDMYYIKGDKRLLNSPINLLFYRGSGKFFNLGTINKQDYVNLKLYASEQDFLKSIINNSSDLKNKNEKFYYIDSIFIELYLNTNKSINDLISFNNEVIERHMLDKLHNDGKSFINHLDHKSSYYAKNAFKYVFTDIDFEPILNLVNDANFEYALNESIACYDNSLYLAALSTAGTALENLMATKLEKEGMLKESEGTEIGMLSGRLKNNGFIDKRDKGRIMIAGKLRNLASHANEGRVIREDVRHVYTTIIYLAEKLFNKNNNLIA